MLAIAARRSVGWVRWQVRVRSVESPDQRNPGGLHSLSTDTPQRGGPPPRSRSDPRSSAWFDTCGPPSRRSCSATEIESEEIHLRIRWRAGRANRRSGLAPRLREDR